MGEEWLVEGKALTAQHTLTHLHTRTHSLGHNPLRLPLASRSSDATHFSLSNALRMDQRSMSDLVYLASMEVQFRLPTCGMHGYRHFCSCSLEIERYEDDGIGKSSLSTVGHLHWYFHCSQYGLFDFDLSRSQSGIELSVLAFCYDYLGHTG